MKINTYRGINLRMISITQVEVLYRDQVILANSYGHAKRIVDGFIDGAVAEVIKAMGFDAMARQYLDEPHYRDRIVAAMARTIRREAGNEKADQFTRLAGAARAA